MGATAGIVVAVIGISESRKQAKQAEKSEERVQERQEKAQLAQDSQRRREEVRRARIQRAKIRQQAQNTGVGGSSSAVSAESGISTSIGILESFRSSQRQAVAGISEELSDAAKFRRRSQTSSTVGGIGINLFTQSEGFQNIFS